MLASGAAFELRIVHYLKTPLDSRVTPSSWFGKIIYDYIR